jgi:hypothetical protein
MSGRNYVCTLCSQTFTRKWRGKTHNLNIHGGSSNVVRMIDYIVGRVNGTYLASDPALFRRRNYKSIFYERSIEKGKSVSDKNTMEQDGHYHLSDGGSSSQSPIQNFSDSPFSDSIERMQEATLKTAELKKLASKYLPPDKVQSIVSEACMLCAVTGKNHPLDMALKSLRKVIELKEAQDYLKSP